VKDKLIIRFCYL